MHNLKIANRDVKLDNVLLEDATHYLPNIRLIDFGTATSFEDNFLMKEKIGTLEYMAPEVLNESEYSCLCDTWSIGVCAYLMLCGKFPFVDKSNKNGNDASFFKRRLSEFVYNVNSGIIDDIFLEPEFIELNEDAQDFI